MVVSIKDIKKAYVSDSKTVYHALDGVSLDIDSGELVAVVGEKGSGKSTLLNILALNLSPDSGSYSYSGAEVTSMREGRLAKIRNKQIGFVSQDFALIPAMTVFENIAMPMRLAGAGKRKIIEKVSRVAEITGVFDALDRRAGDLSGGLRKRTAIARALVNSPSMIIADEPTGSLDALSAAEIVSILTRLNADGTTVIIVTSDPFVAAKCDRKIVMQNGKIISDSKCEPQ